MMVRQQINDSNRTGQSWEEFLKRYRICDIRQYTDGSYEVDSTSGNTYTITTETRIDSMGSMYFVRRCTCPAHKVCRHQNAVERMQWAEAKISEDWDYCDILERTE